MIKRVRAALIAGVLLASNPIFGAVSAREPSAGLRYAQELYDRGDYSGSLSLLDTHATGPEALFLIGRDYYMVGEFRKAGAYLKKATIADPENSEYFDWLGRAYGRRAETSNPFATAPLARKAREAFERAVQLNPRNSEALSDLFDYYLAAPSFLGGGYDKAANVAERMTAIDLSEASSEQSRLSQKRRQLQRGQ